MIIMKMAMAGLLGLVAVSTVAQAPTMSESHGFRAGLDNGDRDSLPRSNRASNIVPSDSRSNVAPTLPPAGLSDNAAPDDFLRAARGALMAGRTGQAQQSLEMAETRMLKGSDTPAEARLQSGDPRVIRIRDALHALGSGDRAHAIRIIDSVLKH